MTDIAIVGMSVLLLRRTGSPVVLGETSSTGRLDHRRAREPLDSGF